MILLVLFITFGLCLVVGPLMMATLNETKMNERHIVLLQAKNGAESAIEYGVAQLKLRWDNQTNFPSDALITQPLSIPSTISTLLWNGTAVSSTSVILTGGIVPPGQWIYVDPTNPANQFDPQRGKMVFARDVVVYAAVTASSTFGGTQTAYAQEALEVRDGPLFADAIFYNMDLELHPGPAQSITGPIHANGNIWAVAETALTFSGPITASGNFNVGLIPWPTNWGSSSESAQTGADVFIPNNTGNLVTPYQGGGANQQVSSSYNDSRQTVFKTGGSNSTYTNWAQFEDNTWGGTLQTAANGVPAQNVIGYNNFQYQVNGTNTDLNYAYAIIEPNQFNPATNPYSKGVGENDKFERQAGLIVKVLGSGAASFSYTVTGNITTGNASVTMYNSFTNNTTVSNFTIAGTPGNNGTINATLVGMGAQGNIDSAINSNVTAWSGNFSNITSAIGGGNSTNVANLNNWNGTAVVLLNQYQQAGNSTNAILNGSGGNTAYMETTPTLSTSGNNTTTHTYVLSRKVGVAMVAFQTLQTTVNPTTGLRTPVYNTSTAIVDPTSNLTIYPGDVIPQNITVNATYLTSNTSSPIYNMLSFSPPEGNNSNGSDLWGGLYDGRRGTPVQADGAQPSQPDEQLLNLDVGKLRNLVDNTIAAGNTAFQNNYTNFFNTGGSNGTNTYNPVNQYNGVVYVEFPQQPPNAARLNSVTSGNTTYPGDQITVSDDGWGLMVANASSNVAGNQTGVPNPSYNNPNQSTFAAAARTPGFTLGTNNCMYVDGSFNADGNINTPEANTTANITYNDTMPDNPNNPDPSVALAADSITVLSSSWVNRKSSTLDNTAASFDEFNAAMLTGIVPSLKYNSSEESGGAQNFPRFLENWGSSTFRYRGSLVCLFESEIANQTWGSNYYSPPARQWGYYNQFSSGVYPPGTPNARSYRRVNFEFLSQAQYTAALAALPAN
jgi:hypothetical protein